MNDPLRLVLFDVDGTLVDSQGAIVGAMRTAFAAQALPAPDRRAILSIVGLSLPQALARLAPEQNAGVQGALVEAYKSAFAAQRAQQMSPLYPGAREALQALAARPNVLIGVATGKSRRGLNALIEAHALTGMFITAQVADTHPSKPHPSMILQAMSETGVAADQTIMVGDTSYDMQMAAAAGVAGVAVTWGYHDRPALGDATTVIEAFADLPGALDQIWKTSA